MKESEEKAQSKMDRKVVKEGEIEGELADERGRLR